MLRLFSLILGTLLATAFCVAQVQPFQPGPPPKKDRLFRTLCYEEDFSQYRLEKLLAIGDSVLAYQFPAGGWPKNQLWTADTLAPKTLRARAELRQAIATHGVGCTIDNYATTREILFLTRLYRHTREPRFREGAIRGLEYLITMQYPNGGWPQFYPLRPAGYDGVEPYADFITFNDDAMVQVMRLLWEVADGKAPYDALRLDRSLRERCRSSFDRGVDCILACQIRTEGRRTVWCQQHNQVTLAPEHARAYELPSYCGAGETVSILHLLMDLPHPSDSVVVAVSSAVMWLESHVIRGYKVVHFTDSVGRHDYCMVETDHDDERIWARFYDLETGRPFFCDRDGIKRRCLSDVCYERRNGYTWIDHSPSEVIERYHQWVMGAFCLRR